LSSTDVAVAQPGVVDKDGYDQILCLEQVPLLLYPWFTAVSVLGTAGPRAALPVLLQRPSPLVTIWDKLPYGIRVS
jgi:hypothetical protein